MQNYADLVAPSGANHHFFMKFFVGGGVVVAVGSGCHILAPEGAKRK